MQIDEILNMWDKDCLIDDNHLDTSSIRTASLHSKYLRILVNTKLKLTKLNSEYASLRKMKIKYYRGELTKEELEWCGWKQYLYNKPLKSEMEEVLNGDSDLLTCLNKIKYIEAVISALESIMNQIKQRDWQIENSIEYKKFISGG